MLGDGTETEPIMAAEEEGKGKMSRKNRSAERIPRSGGKPGRRRAPRKNISGGRR
jgi:hypothetical protein